MSQGKVSTASDALAMTLEAHSLRINELRSFFVTNKIRLSASQKTDLEEIISSLSSILNSSALVKVANCIGENVVAAINSDFANDVCPAADMFADRIIKKLEKSSSSKNVTQPAPAPDCRLPRSYANAVKSTFKNKIQSCNVERMYNDRRNVLFVKKSDKSKKFNSSQVNSLLNNDPTVKINKIFENENNFKIISHDVNSAHKLKRFLERNCNLEVSEKALYDPCVSISGLQRTSSDEV